MVHHTYIYLHLFSRCFTVEAQTQLRSLWQSVSRTETANSAASRLSSAAESASGFFAGTSVAVRLVEAGGLQATGAHSRE